MPEIIANTTEHWLHLAANFFQKEDWPAALAAVRNALRIDAKNLAAWHLGCEILLKQDRPHDARRYAKALKRFALAAGRAHEAAFANEVTSQVDCYFATFHLRMGETDLTHFAARGDISKVRALLDAGADANEKNSTGWTPLHCVAMRGGAAMARLLAENGADLEAEDELKETPLITACRFGNQSVIPVLIELGANIRHVAKEKHTALWYAISSMKDVATVRLLIEAGADANETYEYGDNPFLLAVTYQKADVVNYLLPLTADPARMNQHQVCALHFAAGYNDAALIEQLIARGVDVNQRTNYGHTALMAAAEKNSLDAARLLLAAYTDVNAINQYGDTAVKLAEHHGHSEMLELLTGKKRDDRRGH